MGLSPRETDALVGAIHREANAAAAAPATKYTFSDGPPPELCAAGPEIALSKFDLNGSEEETMKKNDNPTMYR